MCEWVHRSPHPHYLFIRCKHTHHTHTHHLHNRAKSPILEYRDRHIVNAKQNDSLDNDHSIWITAQCTMFLLESYSSVLRCIGNRSLMSRTAYGLRVFVCHFSDQRIHFHFDETVSIAFNRTNRIQLNCMFARMPCQSHVARAHSRNWFIYVFFVVSIVLRNVCKQICHSTMHSQRRTHNLYTFLMHTPIRIVDKNGIEFIE